MPWVALGINLRSLMIKSSVTKLPKRLPSNAPSSGNKILCPCCIRGKLVENLVNIVATSISLDAWWSLCFRARFLTPKKENIPSSSSRSSLPLSCVCSRFHPPQRGKFFLSDVRYGHLLLASYLLCHATKLFSCDFPSLVIDRQ